MKIHILSQSKLILIFVLSLSLYINELSSQNDYVNLRVDEKPISEVFSLISDQTGLRFAYSPDFIDVNKKVSLNVRNKSVKDALYTILPESVTYKQIGRHIIISPSPIERNDIKNKEKSTNYKNENINNFDNKLNINSDGEKIEKISNLNTGSIYFDCHSDMNLKIEEKMKNYLAVLLIGMTTTSFATNSSIIESDTIYDNINIREVPDSSKSTIVNLVSETSEDFVNTLLKPVLSLDTTDVAKIEKTIVGTAQKIVNNIEKSFSTTTATKNSTSVSDNDEVEKSNTKSKEVTPVEEIKSTDSDKVESQKQKKDDNIAQISFIYPIGTDFIYSKDNTYNLSLNIIGGVTGGVNGVEMGGIYNINTYNAKGVQMAGVLNHSGLLESSDNSNVIQFAGVHNYVRKGNAVQIAGVSNIAEFGDAQIAGIVNVAEESNCQISGCVNVTGKGGLQIGLINVRDTADGISIGLINIVKHGGVMEFGIETGDYVHTALMFRSGTKKFYGIIGVGANFNSINNDIFKIHSPFSEKDVYFFNGAGIGTQIDLSKKISLNLELLDYGFINTSDYCSLIQFKPTINFNFANHFKVYFGPNVNLLTRGARWEFVDNSSILPSENGLPLPKNISPSPIYSIVSHTTKNGSSLDMWVGCTFGIKF